MKSPELQEPLKDGLDSLEELYGEPSASGDGVPKSELEIPLKATSDRIVPLVSRILTREEALRRLETSLTLASFARYSGESRDGAGLKRIQYLTLQLGILSARL